MMFSDECETSPSHTFFIMLENFIVLETSWMLVIDDLMYFCFLYFCVHIIKIILKLISHRSNIFIIIRTINRTYPCKPREKGGLKFDGIPNAKVNLKLNILS
jgi:hypothetical protein